MKNSGSGLCTREGLMRRTLILLALCLFPALVSAQIDLDKMRHKQELDALRGFKDFAVLSVTVDGSGAGLEASELGRAITARLAQKGAPVAASAVLNLRVNLRVRSDPRLKGFAVAVAVRRWQLVQVERRKSSSARCCGNATISLSLTGRGESCAPAWPASRTSLQATCW